MPVSCRRSLKRYCFPKSISGALLPVLSDDVLKTSQLGRSTVCSQFVSSRLCFSIASRTVQNVLVRDLVDVSFFDLETSSYLDC